MKTIGKAILILFLSVTILIGGFFGANVIYTRSTHKSVEDLKTFQPELADIPIESCRFVWHPESFIPFGGVLEDVTSGKAAITQEYYNFLLDNYNWRLTRGIPKEVAVHPNAYLYSELTAFLKNSKYYYSEDYQKDKRLYIYLSADSFEIYFYYYQM